MTRRLAKLAQLRFVVDWHLVSSGINNMNSWFAATLVIVLAALVATLFLFRERRNNRLKTERVTTIITSLRKSSNDTLRVAAIGELGAIDAGASETGPPMWRMMATSRHSGLKHAKYQMLARTALLAELRDPSQLVRLSVVEAFGRVASTAVRRLRSAEALARTGAAPASIAYHIRLAYDLIEPEYSLRNYIIPALVAASKDADPRVRGSAIEALKRIGTPEAASALATVSDPGHVPADVAAYYPKQVQPAKWYSLFGYIYRRTSSNLVRADVAGRLGVDLAIYEQSVQQAPFSFDSGIEVAVTLALEGFITNPSTLSIRFLEEWQRFELRFKTPIETTGQTVSGALVFSSEGVIIGEVPVAIEIIDDQAIEPTAQFSTGPVFQAVFCSYSHKDESIVKGSIS